MGGRGENEGGWIKHRKRLERSKEGQENKGKNAAARAGGWGNSLGSPRDPG